MTPTAAQIIQDVAEAYGVTAEDIRSKCRKERLSNARAVSCYLLTRHMGMSCTEVGHEICRDHSTVIYQARKVDDMRKWPTMYADNLAVVRAIEDRYFKHTEP